MYSPADYADDAERNAASCIIPQRKTVVRSCCFICHGVTRMKITCTGHDEPCNMHIINIIQVVGISGHKADKSRTCTLKTMRGVAKLETLLIWLNSQFSSGMCIYTFSSSTICLCEVAMIQLKKSLNFTIVRHQAFILCHAPICNNP